MKRLFVVLGLLAACSDAADTSEAAPGDGGAAAFSSGTEFTFPVAATGRTYVKLDPPGPVAVSDPKASLDWDLAFEGFDVFTNGGVSGSGQGSAFGPLDTAVFLGDTAPEVPFTFADKTGGAFVDWYAYEGAPSHVLWSRYHVYAVRDGARTWKVQIVGYYGEREGAPVSGLYTIRWAEVGSDEVREAANLDATAGGTSAPATAPSECLDLGTGARTMLTPAEALGSSAWHLCFRRQTVSVNGELGGPRNVGAVDLDAARTPSEKVADVKLLTAEGARAKLDAVTPEAVAGLTFRGDRVVSGFGTAWIEPGRAAPASAAWLVADAHGKQHLLGFRRFDGASATSPGTVVATVKPTKE